MESIEFLGGRYNRPEQIMSGPVQAFRAQNAANGRNVFIHRVSTTEAPAEQAGLLKLLTTALVKSSEAKRLVMDFGEERGYWYVVTESEPQCALLREWLQLEIDAALANSRLGGTSAAPEPIQQQPAAKPAFKPTEDSGEFTRFLKARPPVSSPASTPRYTPQTPGAAPQTQPLATQPQASQPQPSAQAPVTKAEPMVGEFTRMFQNSPAPVPAPPAQAAVEPGPIGASVPPPPPVRDLLAGGPGWSPIGASIPPPPPVPHPNPGEFTNFFNTPNAEGRKSVQFSSGIAQSAPLPGPASNLPSSNVPPAMNLPPSPMSVPAVASTAPPNEEGEFTRFFKPGLPTPPPKPAPSGPSTMNFERTQNTQNRFVQRPNTPVPPPPPDTGKPVSPGEFTQAFSRQSAATLPNNSPVPSAPVYNPPPPAVRSDPMGFAKPVSNQPNDLSDQLFNDRIDISKPMPPSQPQQSEFTKMFGAVGAAPPPVQKQAVVAPPPDKSLLEERAARTDSLFSTQPLPAVKPQDPVTGPSQQTGGQAGGGEHTPSEFTMIMQGGYGPSKNAGGGGAAAPKGGSSGSPLLDVNVAGINPLGALPSLGSAGGSMGGVGGHVSSMGATAGSAFGSANISSPLAQTPHIRAPHANMQIPGPGGAGGANKKMTIFFIVIGVLAVLLILLVAFLMKNK
jgi:hypothetical protein